jgi:hypothetical protein
MKSSARRGSFRPGPDNQHDNIIFMKRLLTLLVVLTSSTSIFGTELLPWPAVEKNAVIAGCRKSISDKSEQDFITRHGLKELPPGYHAKTAALIEPYLATCDCAINSIEKSWSYEYFISHQPELPPLLNALTAGKCAVADVKQGASPAKPKTRTP